MNDPVQEDFVIIMVYGWNLGRDKDQGQAIILNLSLFYYNQFRFRVRFTRRMF